MNESDNKIKIVKGNVTQDGYAPAICTIIRANENRIDSFSDKPLYIAEDLLIADNIYAVTPSVTEALNRVPRKTIGAMNEYSEILIPLENSDIVRINDSYIAVKKTNSVEELETVKSDPTKVQENASISQSIKNKILEVDQNARFICDDYYCFYDVYEIKGVLLNKSFENASYIATNNDTIYVQTNSLEDEVQIIGKKVEEPNVTMPVEALADVTDKPLDNLGELPEMPEELPGAPELKNESDTQVDANVETDSFDIDEIQKELAKFQNEVDEEKKQEVETQVPEDIQEQEKEESELEETKLSKTVFEEPTFKDEFEEKRKRVHFNRNYEKSENEKNNIHSIVSAIKARVEESEEEIVKLQNENSEMERALEDKDDEIRKIQTESSKKDYQIEKLQLMLEKKEASLNEIENELKDKDEEIADLNRKIDKYQESMNDIYNEMSGILDSNHNNSRNGRGYSIAA